MAKRFTDTDMWDKEWFMLLSPKMKCFVKYVRDKANLAGIWHPNYHLASTYIGEIVTEADLLSVDNDRQFLKLDCGKIFCIGFISFQYGEVLNEKSPVHKKIIGILQKHIYKNNTLFDTLFNRVLDTDKEEEEDKEEEKDKEVVKEKETQKKTVQTEAVLVNPFSETFLDHWNIWKSYKKKEFRFLFKSIESEQAAINELVGLSQGLEQTAIEIINQSMAKGWKGLFTIKENEQSNSKTTKPGAKITGPDLHEALTKFRSQGKHVANTG